MGFVLESLNLFYALLGKITLFLFLIRCLPFVNFQFKLYLHVILSYISLDKQAN